MIPTLGSISPFRLITPRLQIHLRSWQNACKYHSIDVNSISRKSDKWKRNYLMNVACMVCCDVLLHFFLLFIRQWKSVSCRQKCHQHSAYSCHRQCHSRTISKQMSNGFSSICRRVERVSDTLQYFNFKSRHQHRLCQSLVSKIAYHALFSMIHLAFVIQFIYTVMESHRHRCNVKTSKMSKLNRDSTVRRMSPHTCVRCCAAAAVHWRTAICCQVKHCAASPIISSLNFFVPPETNLKMR